ncbi:potassium channel subfamily K member 16-like isoform X2 [Lineus longissimus]|uniref:potassium channel subfamily K member 16-like isoform X2 n=1 Tax=Lineus longissimus TaxID=88925 RepID=UPI002B4E88B1
MKATETRGVGINAAGIRADSPSSWRKRALGTHDERCYSPYELESEKADDTPSEDSSTMKWKVILVLVIVEAIYVGVGGVIFHFIEEPNETAVRSNSITLSTDFLRNYSCIKPAEMEAFVKAVIIAYDQGVLTGNTTSSQTNWDYASAIFFSSTVVTTIGYGHISPSTGGGRAFCSVYALIGIPINLILLAALGGKMAKAGEKLRHLKSLKDKPRACMTVRLLVCFGVGFIFFVFIPSAIFVATEGWTYGEAVYYSVITLTTVGFGDFVAGLDYSGNLRGLYRISISFWIVIGLAWVGWLIGDAQEFGTTVISKIASKESQKSEKDEEKRNGDDNRNLELHRNYEMTTYL